MAVKAYLQCAECQKICQSGADAAEYLIEAGTVLKKVNIAGKIKNSQLSNF